MTTTPAAGRHPSCLALRPHTNELDMASRQAASRGPQSTVEGGFQIELAEIEREILLRHQPSIA